MLEVHLSPCINFEKWNVLASSSIATLELNVTGDEWEEEKKMKKRKEKWSAGNKFNTSYRDISVILAVLSENSEQIPHLN